MNLMNLKKIKQFTEQPEKKGYNLASCNLNRLCSCRRLRRGSATIFFLMGQCKAEKLLNFSAFLNFLNFLGGKKWNF